MAETENGSDPTTAPVHPDFARAMRPFQGMSEHDQRAAMLVLLNSLTNTMIKLATKDAGRVILRSPH